MFLILTTSANIFVGQHIVFTIIMGFLFMFFAYPSVFKIKINKETVPILIILFFISFEFVHKIIFGLDNTLTIIRILGYYFFAYFSVKALKTKFIPVFINMVYFLAIISLIFYVVSIIPGVNTLVYNFADKMFSVTNDFTGYHRPTIIIFTFSPEYIIKGIAPLRNAGFTFEAGMLGFFLNLAIFFHYTYNSKSTIKNLFTDKKFLIMIIALLLTFSTTAYIVLAFYLTYFSIKEKGIKKYFFMIVISILLFYSFNNVSFLKNKIESQLETAQVSQNRFGSAILDWLDIKRRPFFGWSRKDKVLFGSETQILASHRPNGLTNYLRRYGFINIFFFIIFLFISFKKYFIFIKVRHVNSLAVIALLIILVSSFSELILEQEIIKSFLFLPYVYKIQKT